MLRIMGKHDWRLIMSNEEEPTCLSLNGEQLAMLYFEQNNEHLQQECGSVCMHAVGT